MSASAPASTGQASPAGVHGPWRWSTTSANGSTAAVVTPRIQNMMAAGAVLVRLACCVKRFANAHEKAVTSPSRTTTGV